MSGTALLAGTVRAEVLKLRKRPAWWVLAGVLLAAVVLFGYLLTYAFLSGAGGVPGMDADAFLRTLLPENLVPTSLNQLASFGGPVALILAVLVVGSEYGWGTMKTLATQRPARATLVLGKVAVLVMAVGALVLATVACAALASLVIASLEGEAAALPPVGDIIGGLGAGWLMLSAYALIGALLALLFRGVGLAVGLGLVHLLVIETALLALPLPDWFSDAAAQVLLSSNAGALAGAFGDLPSGTGMGMEGAPSPGQAAVVLTCYVIAFAAVGVLLVRRRPIT